MKNRYMIVCGYLNKPFFCDDAEPYLQAIVNAKTRMSYTVNKIYDLQEGYEFSMFSKWEENKEVRQYKSSSKKSAIKYQEDSKKNNSGRYSTNAFYYWIPIPEGNDCKRALGLRAQLEMRNKSKGPLTFKQLEKETVVML